MRVQHIPIIMLLLLLIPLIPPLVSYRVTLGVLPIYLLEPSTPIMVASENSYSFTIKVLDNSLKPVSGARVFIMRENVVATGVTGNDGSVVLSWSGLGTLFICKCGFLTHTEIVNVDSDKTQNFTLDSIVGGDNTFYWRDLELEFTDSGKCSDISGVGSRVSWYVTKSTCQVNRSDKKVISFSVEKVDEGKYKIKGFSVTDNNIRYIESTLKVTYRVVGKHIEGTVEYSDVKVEYKAYNLDGDLLIVSDSVVARIGGLGSLVEQQVSKATTFSRYLYLTLGLFGACAVAAVVVRRYGGE